jgi:hypothetical protein
MSFYYIHTVSCNHILGQLSYTMHMVKEIPKKKLKKHICILLSVTLTVFTSSAVRYTIRSSTSVVDAVYVVRCSSYPKIHLFYGCISLVHLYRYLNELLFLFYG